MTRLPTSRWPMDERVTRLLFADLMQVHAYRNIQNMIPLDLSRQNSEIFGRRVSPKHDNGRRPVQQVQNDPHQWRRPGDWEVHCSRP